jgi:hypothetical protein
MTLQAKTNWVLQWPRTPFTYQIDHCLLICCLSARSTQHCQNVLMVSPPMFICNNVLWYSRLAMQLNLCCIQVESTGQVVVARNIGLFELSGKIKLIDPMNFELSKNMTHPYIVSFYTQLFHSTLNNVRQMCLIKSLMHRGKIKWTRRWISRYFELQQLVRYFRPGCNKGLTA